MGNMGKRFAKALEEALIASGLKPYDIYKRVGVSQSLLSQYRHGTATPSFATVRKIALGLNAPIDSLLNAAEADREERGHGRKTARAKTSKPWPHHDFSQSSAGNKGIDFNSTGRDFKNRDVTNAHAEDRLSINSDTGVQIPGARPLDEFGPMVRIPVYGLASCGSPTWVSDEPEEYLELPSEFVEGSTAALRVKGESMMKAGFRDGDRLLVRPLDGETPENEDAVIASIDGDCVCKLYEKKNGIAFLRSAPGYGDPEIIPITDRVRLVAVVVSVLSRRKK